MVGLWFRLLPRIFAIDNNQDENWKTTSNSFHGSSVQRKDAMSDKNGKTNALAIYRKKQLLFQLCYLSFTMGSLISLSILQFFLFFYTNSLDRQYSERANSKRKVAQLKRQQFHSLDSQSNSLLKGCVFYDSWTIPYITQFNMVHIFYTAPSPQCLISRRWGRRSVWKVALDHSLHIGAKCQRCHKCRRSYKTATKCAHPFLKLYPQ